MDIHISYYTSQGNRDYNEDALSVVEGSGGILAMVADGLGGHEDGHLASRQAVATVGSLLQGRTPSQNSMKEAIWQADDAINRIQRPGSRMHTTICAVWISSGVGVAAHVGDSRIYQFRQGRIIFQSRDHSLAQMSVLLGDMSPQELRGSRDRNKLTRALGIGELPKVDSQTLDVQPGDRFLLCSDGFWEAVTEETMERSLSQSPSVGAWLEQMHQVVKDRAYPRQDNHTAIAMEVAG